MTVDSGFENTSFKCKVGRYEYCRHDPVRWSDQHNPIVIHVVLGPGEDMEFWVWTPKCAELPATLALTLWCSKVPYRYYEDLVAKAYKQAAAPVAVV